MDPQKAKKLLNQPVLFTALLIVLSCSDPAPVQTVEPIRADAPLHKITIHTPTWVGTLDAGRQDAIGEQIGIHCDTCHGKSAQAAIARREPVPTDKSGAFHAQIRQVKEQHGDLACTSCHNELGKMQSVAHLADQSPVDYPNVVYLCGQCHGPQLRAYLHGAHGGMNGYWDARLGPITRNNCVDCHNPHAPAFPKMAPAPPPQDRHMTPSGGNHE